MNDNPNMMNNKTLYIKKYVRVDLTENYGVVNISMCIKYRGFHFEESTLIIATINREYFVSKIFHAISFHLKQFQTKKTLYHIIVNIAHVFLCV